jgi:broad specificity phosphatase PhoE
MHREIIYETHATSEHNERGIASGHLDPPLSAKGGVQALDLGKRHALTPPDLILCSDLKRSYQTA